MIIMKGSKDNRMIDYSKTTFLMESYHLGHSGITKLEFQAFQCAVRDHNDRVILEILTRNAVKMQFWF